MRRGMIALVGAVMLSWSGTSFAAGLADRAGDFEGSFTSLGAASPSLSLPLASQLHLMPAGGKEGGRAVQMDDSTRAIIATVLGLLVGFGSGHFVLGDGAAWLFLTLDVGVIAGIVGIWVAAYATILSGAVPFFIFIATPILVLAALVVRIWEFVDVLMKSGIAAGPPAQSEVIVPRTGAFAQSAFQPAMANGLSLRF